MLRPRKHHLQRPLRRFCVGLMLFAYLFTVAGFPARSPTKKHGSHPFPCQDHDCGCATAEECWTNCCCFSPEQHLAWARQQAIEPPGYAIVPTEGAPTTPQAGQGCGHCDDHQAHEDSSHRAFAEHQEHEQEAAGCCEKHTQPAGCQARSESTPNFRWVLSIKALGCRGLSTLWVASGSVAPPPAIVTWQALRQFAGQSPVQTADAFLRQTPPLDPPPRLAKSL